MSAHSRIFDSFRNDNDLGSRAAAISARKQVTKVCVGVQIKGQRMFAAVDRAIQLDPGEAEDQLVPAACLAKPLTATLLAEAAPKHHIDWSDEISDVLGVGSPRKAKLAGVSLASLLNHTHGLDASTVPRVPRTHDGFVDVEALCDQLATAPLSAPGRLYSYSNAGAWFAGALLERLSGQSYSQLLHERQLWPVSLSSKPLYAAGVCPATGEQLELTLSQWLAFLNFHLRDWQVGTDAGLAQALASLRTDPIPLPGWSPSEQGACLGWKHYGGRWFGHNSTTVGSSALLRFNPEQHIAIVIEASDDTAFVVLAGLFGTALPEFTNLRPPRLLPSKESGALQFDRYTGTYVQARSRLGVGTSRGSLYLTVEMQGSSAATAQRLLRPAEGELFIPDPRDDPEFAFVQFIAAEPTRAFGHLWNGKQLWRRE